MTRQKEQGEEQRGVSLMKLSRGDCRRNNTKAGLDDCNDRSGNACEILCEFGRKALVGYGSDGETSQLLRLEQSAPHDVPLNIPGAYNIHIHVKLQNYIISFLSLCRGLLNEPPLLLGFSSTDFRLGLRLDQASTRLVFPLLLDTLERTM